MMLMKKAEKIAMYQRVSLDDSGTEKNGIF
jgi:hypothetical protein